MTGGEGDGEAVHEDVFLFEPSPEGTPAGAVQVDPGWVAGQDEPSGWDQLSTSQPGTDHGDTNQGSTGQGGTAQRSSAHAGHRGVVHWLLDEVGGTYSAEAEIPLADRPAPLYRLLVLATLLATQPEPGVAVRATRELAGAGLRTPGRMVEDSGDHRSAALERAGCAAVPATADALAAGARRLVDRYRGDLRRLRGEGEHKPARILRLLGGFAGMGEPGAAIFACEAQAVWPELRPSLDPAALVGARLLGLPGTVGQLAALVPETDLARLAAALTRISSDPRLAGSAPVGAGHGSAPGNGHRAGHRTGTGHRTGSGHRTGTGLRNGAGHRTGNGHRGAGHGAGGGPNSIPRTSPIQDSDSPIATP